MVLDKGRRAQVELNRAEPDAIELAISGTANEYQRKLLQELLEKIDSAPTVPGAPKP